MSDPNSPDPSKQAIGRRGGPDTHKPGCKCNACVARRRKAEAVAQRVGPDTPEQAVQPSQGEVLTDGIIIGTNLQRDRIKKWLQWKAIEPKLTHAEAASRLGIATQTLTNLIYDATKAGWLQFTDPLAELEYEIIPQANRVVKNALKSGDTDMAAKVSAATIWKQFAAAKGVGETPTTVLALKIEMPEGVEASKVPIKGVIVGQPRTIDAEIIEVKDE